MQKWGHGVDMANFGEHTLGAGSGGAVQTWPTLVSTLWGLESGDMV